MATIQEYPDLLDYVNAKLKRDRDSKSMMSFLCEVALRADAENFEIIRPSLATFAEKYPALLADLEAERRDRGA